MRPALVAGLVLAWSAAGALDAQRATFTSGIDLVHFGVIVADRRGNFVTDLDEEDFEIFEDGEKQTLRYFARGDQRDSLPTLHLGLLFDTSGSMTEDLKFSRSAAIKFLNTLTDAVDITLVDFDTEVRVARYGQPDFPRLVERIRSRDPDGWTALYDAVGVYLDGAADQDGRKILVLYTDGGDTRSVLGFGDMMDLLRASDVTVYAIGFLEHQSSFTRAEQRMRLQQIAELTGGQAFFPFAMKDLDAEYAKVQAEILAQYALGYVSTNPRADGSWRKVEIKVKRPGLKDIRLRTRKGYFARYKETPSAKPKR